MNDILSFKSEPDTDAKASRRRGVIRRFGRDRKGVAAIEFAMLAIPFFAMIFATIETGIVFLAEMTLDQAVEQVGRTVRTGQVQKASLSKEAFKQRICDRVSFLLACDKLIVDVGSYGNDFSAIPPPLKNGKIDTASFGYAPGAANTVSAVRVYYKWPIVTDVMRTYLADGGSSGDGTHLIYSIAAFRTEPF